MYAGKTATLPPVMPPSTPVASEPEPVRHSEAASILHAGVEHDAAPSDPRSAGPFEHGLGLPPEDPRPVSLGGQPVVDLDSDSAVRMSPIPLGDAVLSDCERRRSRVPLGDRAIRVGGLGLHGQVDGPGHTRQTSAREASDAWSRSWSCSCATGSRTSRAVCSGLRGRLSIARRSTRSRALQWRCVDEHTHRWVYLSV